MDNRNSSDFNDQINNKDLSCVSDLSCPGGPMIIAFGGVFGELAVPAFEFFGLTNKLEINKLYLRDHWKAWYHKGLKGISTSVQETAVFLQRKIIEANPCRVICMGNSMGGYGAILFGVMLRTHSIHAFSAQTFINNTEYIRHSCNRDQIEWMQKTFSPKYFDLKWLARTRGEETDIHLYYNINDTIDRKHAENLLGIDRVHLHSFSGQGHQLVRELKESGKLKRIIHNSIQG